MRSPVQSWFAAMWYFLVMKLKYNPLCCYDIGAFPYIQNEYIFHLITGIQRKSIILNTLNLATPLAFEPENTTLITNELRTFRPLRKKNLSDQYAQRRPSDFFWIIWKRSQKLSPSRQKNLNPYQQKMTHMRDNLQNLRTYPTMRSLLSSDPLLPASKLRKSLNVPHL